ncbi:TonB-dependent receptor domain-containing protein [Aquimarina hainanensis]|uniref:TonB-dependent receptor domain-containing protein n=1 Tax=Aquimarina hainanensis TaxID=1578017 RepID=A0ABW5NC41_9FLAO
MRQLIWILFTFCIAKTIQAQESGISIVLENITIKEALERLEKNTKKGSFAFNNNLKSLQNKIDKTYVNKSLDYILKEILSPAFLSYKYIGETVVILEVEPPKKYTISGYIKDKDSQELLPGVAIYATSLQKGVITNGYGFYSLTLPEGTHEITYSFLGFKTISRDIVLTSNIQEDFFMEEDITYLNEVVVVSDKKEKEKESRSSQMSEIGLPIKQAQDVPMLLGEKDMLKVFQLMPGVHAGAEGNTGLYVRGGGPDQNLIILDDATVYNVNHVLGLFSVFSGDALKSAKLYKGAFPARYGGRLSSVIDMRMIEGNKKEYHGKIGIGLISSNVTIEGPIKKNKSSFLFSGRRSYIDLIVRPLVKKEGERPTLSFFDMNMKVNFELGKKDKLYASGYFGRDSFGSEEKDKVFGDDFSEMSWGNATTTLRWNHQFNAKSFANTSLIYSDYSFYIKTERSLEKNTVATMYESNIRDLGIKYDMDIIPSLEHHIRTGVHFTNHEFNPGVLSVDHSSNASTFLGRKYINNELAVYVEDDWKITQRLKANIGARISSFKSGSKIYIKPEPRISFGYRIQKNLAIKASYSSMNQYVHLLTSSGALLPTDLWVPSTEKIRPQSSKQLAIGAIKDFKNNISLSIESYYKKSDNVIGYKEGAGFLGTNSSSVEQFDFNEVVTSGKAWAYGTEFFLQKKFGKFSGWIGYALSWSERQFDDVNFGKKFLAKYDRRHDASVVLSYKPSKKITLGANWIYGSGNNYSLANGGIKTVFNTPINDLYRPNGDDVIGNLGVFSQKNDFRGESTHRLDLGIQFHKQKKGRKRTWEISIYNAYARYNPFGYRIKKNYDSNLYELQRISLLGIIPSFSYKLEF